MPRFKVEKEDDGHHLFMTADDGVIQAEWEFYRVFEDEFSARLMKKVFEGLPVVNLEDWRPC